jgi:hypothetical protein
MPRSISDTSTVYHRDEIIGSIGILQSSTPWMRRTNAALKNRGDLITLRGPLLVTQHTCRVAGYRGDSLTSRGPLACGLDKATEPVTQLRHLLKRLLVASSSTLLGYRDHPAKLPCLMQPVAVKPQIRCERDYAIFAYQYTIHRRAGGVGRGRL